MIKNGYPVNGWDSHFYLRFCGEKLVFVLKLGLELK